MKACQCCSYIPDDENVPTPITDKEKKIARWEDIDPIGSARIPHRSEKGYVVPDEGNCAALNDETGTDTASAKIPRSGENAWP